MQGQLAAELNRTKEGPLHPKLKLMGRKTQGIIRVSSTRFEARLLPEGLGKLGVLAKGLNDALRKGY